MNKTYQLLKNVNTNNWLFIILFGLIAYYIISNTYYNIKREPYDLFDIVNTTDKNDHYGYWFSSKAYPEHTKLSAKEIRLLQADYLHKSKPCVYKYKNTYTCVGFGLANSVFIELNNSIIVNDVGTDTKQGEAMIKVIKQVTNKPVSHVIFGHNHLDHTGGIGAYLQEWPELKIIAHENIHYNIKNTSSVISDILGVRSAKHAGINVPDDLFDHAGIGPHKEVNTEHSTYKSPDIVLDDKTKTMELDGETFDFMWAPSETDDELCVFYRTHNILLTNEIINPSAPSSYTLRGTKRRDIKIWIDTLDAILERYPNSVYMAPTHGRPVIGQEMVNKRISEYKEATKSMLEQTLKLMNEGMKPDEIEHYVEIPNELRTPWNYYDHYNFQASFPKAIYQNYLGHYNGDPYTLLINKESHPHKRACYFIKDINNTFTDIENLVNNGEKAFASELLTYIIQCPETSETNRNKAKQMKAKYYMELADEQTSSNLRNWLITDSLLLQNKMDFKPINFKVKMLD